MKERISLNKFFVIIGKALARYPYAKVTSITSKMDENHNWNFILLLDCDGDKIEIKIPCYMEVNY